MKMQKFKIGLKTLLLASLALLVLPMNAYAAETEFEDGAECFSEIEEQHLEENISTICGEFPIKVHIITNKNETGKGAEDYVKERISADESEYSLGIMYDFYNSEYAIAAGGETVKYITSDIIEKAYQLGENAFKDDKTVYDCANIMIKHCLTTMMQVYNGEVIEQEEIDNAISEVNELMEASIVDATITTIQAGDATILVHDLANLLAPQEEDALANYIKSNYSDLRYNILFLTTNDTQGKNSMTYSDDYMDLLFPDEENNIAFMVDMQNREIYINTMGKAIDSLSDMMIQKALDKGYTYVVAADYYNTLKEMSVYCLDRLENPLTWIEGLWGNMLELSVWSLIVVSIIGVFAVLNHNAANRTISDTKYLSREDYKVVGKKEKHVRSYDTVERGYYRSSSSSSGGGSHHSSSSGRSHGGGGRRF